MTNLLHKLRLRGNEDGTKLPKSPTGKRRGLLRSSRRGSGSTKHASSSSLASDGTNASHHQQLLTIENQRLQDQCDILNLKYQKLERQFVATRHDYQTLQQQSTGKLQRLKNQHIETVLQHKRELEQHESKLLQDEFSKLMEAQMQLQESQEQQGLTERKFEKLNESLEMSKLSYEADKAVWDTERSQLEEAAAEHAERLEELEMQIQGLQAALYQAIRKKEERIKADVPEVIEWIEPEVEATPEDLQQRFEELQRQLEQLQETREREQLTLRKQVLEWKSQSLKFELNWLKEKEGLGEASSLVTKQWDQQLLELKAEQEALDRELAKKQPLRGDMGSQRIKESLPRLDSELFESTDADDDEGGSSPDDSLGSPAMVKRLQELEHELQASQAREAALEEQVAKLSAKSPTMGDKSSLRRSQGQDVLRKSSSGCLHTYLEKDQGDETSHTYPESGSEESSDSPPKQPSHSLKLSSLQQRLADEQQRLSRRHSLRMQAVKEVMAPTNIMHC